MENNKKVLENIIEKYIKTIEEKTKVLKAQKETEKELKSLWNEWAAGGIKKQVETLKDYQSKKENIVCKKLNEQNKNFKYLQVLENVYKKLLSIAAYNVVLAALKEESKKKKTKLNKPARYKVVNDFIVNSIESDKIHCYVKNTSYSIELHFMVNKNYYNDWIVTGFYLLNDGPSWEEKYFDLEKIKKAEYKKIDYDPGKIAKNYLDFVENAKKEIEKFKNDFDEKRKKATENNLFNYLIPDCEKIEETFYF